jgi:hypothetical protein
MLREDYDHKESIEKEESGRYPHGLGTTMS